MNLGVDADAALRGTALACFLLTAVLLYGLTRRVAGRAAAVGALVAFLFSPFGLEWSRASLVEYLATAGAVGMVWAGIEWRERRHWAFVVLAVVAGTAAMLVKLTTGSFWILPLLLYTVSGEGKGLRAWIRNRVEPGLVTIVALPLVAGYVWTRHADAIKDARLATRWLTSKGLQTWNFGTLSQRLELRNWSTILDRADLLVGGQLVLLGLVVLALWWGHGQRFWLGIVLVVVLSPAVFFNLYVVHDYYLAAISPALAALVGLASAWLWSHRPSSWAPSIFVTALVLVWTFVVIAPSWAYIRPVYDPPIDPFVAAVPEVQRTVPAGSLVVYLGADWNPTTPYYADRPGIMVGPTLRSEPAFVEQLPHLGARYVFSFSPDIDALHLLSRWPWVGVVGPRTYIVGSHRADVDDAPVYASTARVAADHSSSETITCGAASDASSHDLIDAPPTALRIRVHRDLAPLPRVGVLYVRPGDTVSCSGARSARVSVDPQ
jgi:hypothetical protein